MTIQSECEDDWSERRSASRRSRLAGTALLTLLLAPGCASTSENDGEHVVNVGDVVVFDGDAQQVLSGEEGVRVARDSVLSRFFIGLTQRNAELYASAFCNSSLSDANEFAAWADRDQADGGFGDGEFEEVAADRSYVDAMRTSVDGVPVNLRFVYSSTRPSSSFCLIRVEVEPPELRQRLMP